METVDRMDGLLDDLMLLVRSGTTLPRRERVDLAAVAGAAARRAGDGPVALDLELHSVAVRGEPRLLERLPRTSSRRRPVQRAGWFRPRLHRERGRRGAPARRQQRPAGAAPGAAARAVRARRPRPRRSRRGLGLSIVRAVAEAHGGQVALTPRPEGGLTVDVLLPRG